MHALRQRMAERRAHGESGFTLVELLVVLAILGLLVAVATPQVLKYLGKAKNDTAQIEMKSLSTALDLFMIDVGRYPTQDEGLQVLISNASNLNAWHGPYLKANAVPLDPWGRPYQYRIPGQRGEYDLFTTGAETADGYAINQSASRAGNGYPVQ